MTPTDFQKRVDQLQRCVQQGDAGTALSLLGEVVAEAEQRGYERGKAEALALMPVGEPAFSITRGIGSALGPPAGYEPDAKPEEAVKDEEE